MGVLVLHMVLVIIDFMSYSWWDGILDILAVSIGYCAIREPFEYEVSRLLCYIIFLILDCFWAAIKVCLFFAGVKGTPSGIADKSWQYYTYIIMIVGGTALYLAGFFIAWKLYKSLKAFFDPLEGQGVPPAQGYGGGYAPVPGQAEYAQPAAPTAPGFTAFAGKGHTLGGVGGSRPAAQQQRQARTAPRASPAQGSIAVGMRTGGRNVRQQPGHRGIPAAALARLEQKSKPGAN